MKTKGIRTSVIVTIIVICFVIAGGISYYLLKTKPLASEGAYLEYEATAVAPLLGSISGTVRGEIVSITEDTITFSITSKGDISALIKPETKTIRRGEPIGPALEEEMEYEGDEILQTVVGKRTVEHYYHENITEERIEKTDKYLDKETEALLLAYVTFDELGYARVRLSDTNIRELKGFPVILVIGVVGGVVAIATLYFIWRRKGISKRVERD